MAISTIGQNGLNAPLSLTSPNLGTPSALVLTNATALAKAALPTGSVLQVVSSYNNTASSTSSTSYSATNVTASITPLYATSKILVTVHCADLYKSVSTGGGVNLQVLRNSSTNILDFAKANGYTSVSTQNNVSSASGSYLDSPATTSSTSYTVYIAAATASVACAINSSGGYSTIVLMEIAA